MEKGLFPSALRRLRSNALIRSLVNPMRLSHQSFILPLFVEQDLKEPRLVKYMHGVKVETPSSIFKAIDDALDSGISKFLIFPVPTLKSSVPSDFSFASNVVQAIKAAYGQDIWLASDLCLCSYTTHGHCGILSPAGDSVLNHDSVQVLADYAATLAQAGVDCVAPSDMMDGRVKAIRKQLLAANRTEVVIMSYSSKFSSQWYGPFRDACHSTPNSAILKDRKSYQLSPLNTSDAINCAIRDAEEGADILMVKPAGLYTDIISKIKERISMPLAAYHVSGEYSAIETMAHLGAIDRAQAHLETWSSLQRSGADIIISYAAMEAKKWIENYEY
ncbi:MAG: porphobilinogen synthase [Saprospiraceae bacterium]|jgi:porphobilinogen synthase|nr:porphobilinogen synthase [Saprospiraceae bacterium]MBK8511773.1 porphobilinogen synthase [Saprospiraceae bacterium]MBK8777223.1 porphobilinogen synthase [Saprospiraceae bacterium]MBK9930371.1 porphobilinogen synthase [Saprospiraceae bacterium]MBL0113403.1 porphobilinogen synthase [Saprospiraceae bacterium]